ncbi:MAG TPA: DegQ family serine endoprotease [Desulfomonilia bacterium]
MKKIHRLCTLSVLALLLTAGISLAATADMFQGEWVADVAQKVIPSVVNIASTKTVVDRSPFYSDPFFRDFFGNAPQEERVQRSLGSGVIISPDGYILTNNHVVGGADKVEVKLSDSRVFTAHIIGTDPKSDVAVIKIDSRGLPWLPVGDSSKLRIGTFVLAVGNPFGLGQTVTLGIVSALGRSGLGITDYENFIQTDAAINPGNSGGALVNMRGELVGINTSILSRSGGNIGIGFAIPADFAISIKNSLVRYGKVIRGWLGVTTQDIDAGIARSLKMATPRGVIVVDVSKGSPAANAGIRRGDIITAINGKVVQNSISMRFMVSEILPGTQAKVSIIRKDREFVIPVQAGDLSRAAASGSSLTISNNRFLGGLTAREIDDAVRDSMNLSANESGVIITEIKRGSNADGTGLKPGDIILKLGRNDIKTLEDFKKATDSLTGRKLSMSILRGGVVMTTTIFK